MVVNINFTTFINGSNGLMRKYFEMRNVSYRRTVIANASTKMKKQATPFLSGNKSKVISQMR